MVKPEDIYKARIESYEDRYNNGDKTALLDCLCYCLNKEVQLDIPKWCRWNFIVTVREARDYKFASWDDAFGRLHPKGTNIEKKRQQRILTKKVIEAISQHRKAGEVVDNELFEQVAEEIGDVSRSTVSRIYYKQKKVWEQLPREARRIRTLKMAFDGE